MRVELEDIGEGWSGEYDPDDPDDEPLLRFTVLDDTGEPFDDASYCTRLPASLSGEDRKLIKDAILRRVEGEASIKKVCEELSWLSMEDVERLRMSNLPPGVNANMIPGNRPEDDEEDNFWNEFEKKLNEQSMFDATQPEIDDVMQTDWFMWCMQQARELGYNVGYNDCKYDIDMEGIAHGDD